MTCICTDDQRQGGGHGVNCPARLRDAASVSDDRPDPGLIQGLRNSVLVMRSILNAIQDRPSPNAHIAAWARAHIEDVEELLASRQDDAAAAVPRSVETAGLDDLHGLPLEDVLRWVFAQYQVIPDEPKVVVLGWAADAAKIVAEKMRKAAAEHVGRSPAAPRPEGMDGRHPDEVYADELERKQRDLDAPRSVETREARNAAIVAVAAILRDFCPDMGSSDRATLSPRLVDAAIAALRSVETAGLREAAINVRNQALPPSRGHEWYCVRPADFHALRAALSSDTETRTLGGTSGTNPPPPPPQDRG